MRRVLRKLCRVVAVLLVLVVATGLSITCAMSAAEMTAAQKACCAEMTDCDGMPADIGCCPSPSPSLISAPPSVPLLQVAPPVVVVSHVIAIEPDVRIPVRRVAPFDVPASKSASPPTYLLVSVFRI